MFGPSSTCDVGQSESPPLAITIDESQADTPRSASPLEVDPMSRDEPNPPASTTPDLATSNAQRKKKHPTPPPHQAKGPNMALIYANKLSQKSDYMAALIDKKDKWKSDEIVDRQEARADEHGHPVSLGRLQWKHEEKKSRLEREHQLAIIKTKKRVALLGDLFKSNRSESEMKSLISLFDEVTERDQDMMPIVGRFFVDEDPSCFKCTLFFLVNAMAMLFIFSFFLGEFCGCYNWSQVDD